MRFLCGQGSCARRIAILVQFLTIDVRYVREGVHLPCPAAYGIFKRFERDVYRYFCLIYSPAPIHLQNCIDTAVDASVFSPSFCPCTCTHLEL